MGLDAAVYCDCFELGRLKSKPKPEWKVYVTENGSRECNCKETHLQEEFDSWNDDKACEHENGIALYHDLGNSSHVALLRTLLSKCRKAFPILTEEVLYSGTHCGDWIEYKSMPDLLKEVELISDCRPRNSRDKKMLQEFAVQMKDLIECSMKLRKPIAF
jgi:hypothetical protein